MFSLHADQDLERILAGLAGRGAVGLLLIEAGPLERIERRYGGAAHQLAMNGLLNLIREVALEAVLAQDLLVTEERPRGAILVFMFQPRSDSRFYTTRLRSLAAAYREPDPPAWTPGRVSVPARSARASGRRLGRAAQSDRPDGAPDHARDRRARARMRSSRPACRDAAPRARCSS